MLSNAFYGLLLAGALSGGLSVLLSQTQVDLLCGGGLFTDGAVLGPGSWDQPGPGL